ncbi:hypothetical protein BLNAU_11651 [Blattamonas nauphoetae]|uniref:Uncharacterized protein n=1 Tax=Blattamonas nauphoetae TaxID=2049346 RepID=A0ABQ9XS45_9EUKA|nr:hypothetical protein BLNAU_11651 [Blattamonas nauphoetae]
MLFLFALLSASSFKVPNDDPTEPDPTITIEYSDIDKAGAGTITVTGADLAAKSEGGFDPVHVTLLYTPPTPGAAITLTTSTKVTVEDGGFTHPFTIAVKDAGSDTVFQHGVKYALTTVTVEGVDPRSGTADEAFTPTIPTLALTYSEATTTTFTLTATFTDDKSGNVKVTFKPATDTEKSVEVTIAFGETPKKTETATLTVAEAGSTTAFKIGEKYTATFTDYRVTGDEWTPTNPLTTTYASKLTPVDEEKKDGAKDPITVTCTNGMIKKALIEGDNTTQILVLTDADAKETKLSQVENKINFTITDGQCVVSYVFNDAPIKKSTVGKAQLNLGTTFL